MWVNKFSPKSLDEIPQNSAKLKDFVLNFKKQKKKAMLIYGPPGSCKTAAVHALAKDLDLEIVEINASDARNAESIKSLVGSALKQQSLFSKGKIILVDEIDGVSGKADRGGISALASLIAKSHFPVFLTANDPWDSKFSSLRSKSVMIEFPAVPITGVMKVLKNISSKTNAPSNIIKSVARQNSGDLRSAIIDFQVASSDSSLDALGERQRTQTIMNALNLIFRSSDASVVVSVFDTLGENLDDCLVWIEENLPKVYTNPKDLANAFDILSRADVFRGRIRRWQYWRYLSYVNVLLTAGIATAKENRVERFVKFSRSQRFLKRWIMNRKLAKRNSIAFKLADILHCSQKKAIEQVPFLKQYFQRHASALIEELSLDEDEIKWLEKG